VVCYEDTDDSTKCCGHALCARCVFSLLSPDCPMCRRRLQHRAPLPAHVTMTFGSDMMQLNDLASVMLSLPPPRQRRSATRTTALARASAVATDSDTALDTSVAGEAGCELPPLRLPPVAPQSHGTPRGRPPGGTGGGGVDGGGGGGGGGTGLGLLTLRLPEDPLGELDRELERVRRFGLASSDYSVHGSL